MQTSLKAIIHLPDLLKEGKHDGHVPRSPPFALVNRGSALRLCYSGSVLRTLPSPGPPQPWLGATVAYEKHERRLAWGVELNRDGGLHTSLIRNQLNGLQYTIPHPSTCNILTLNSDYDKTFIGYGQSSFARAPCPRSPNHQHIARTPDCSILASNSPDLLPSTGSCSLQIPRVSHTTSAVRLPP